MYSDPSLMNADSRAGYYNRTNVFANNYGGGCGPYLYPMDSNYNNNNSTSSGNIDIFTEGGIKLRDSERRSERSRYERDRDRDYRRENINRTVDYDAADNYYNYNEHRSGMVTNFNTSYDDGYPNSYQYNMSSASRSTKSYGNDRYVSSSDRSSSSFSTYDGSDDGSSYRSTSKSRSSRRRHRRSRDRDRTRSRKRDSRDRDRRDRDRGRGRDRSVDRERDRGREKDRRDRDRSRERDRSRDRSRDKSRDRDRGKGRDRTRERDRDREHSPKERDSRRFDSSRDSKATEATSSSVKDETPNHTIMLRGLPLHITENEIRSDIFACGLEAKDVRLVRKHDTGASRGFAFVEFKTTSEAKLWMDARQGIMVNGQYRIPMHYSIPKENDNRNTDGSNSSSTTVVRLDWNCAKCGAHNFRRRDFCFKCNAPREEADESKYVDGYDETSTFPRHTLLFRNLDALTTEEKVLNSLQAVSTLPIKNIRVAKDTLTGTSRGFCYVELNSTAEATILHDQLLARETPLYVDNRIVAVSYARQSISTLSSNTSATVASTAVAAAQWTNQVSSSTYGTVTNYGMSHAASAAIHPPGVDPAVPSYGSSAVSATGSTVTTVYGASTVTNYSQVGTLPSSSGVSGDVAATGASTTYNNTTPTVASSPAIDLKAVGVVGPDGNYPKFASPDVSTYQYDKTSGYYYDPMTGLHYDANSQYYYNSQTQQFLYWDGTKQSYLPASSEESTSVATVSSSTATIDGTEAKSTTSTKKVKEKDKQDKVKIAKKVAKDMEKWAKTLNQKKKNAKQGIVANQAFAADSFIRQPATADAGFAILEKKATLAERQAAVIEALKKKDASQTGKDSESSLVAAYGEGSESEDEESGPLDESRLLDMQKLACLLCKRQFPSKDALMRHQQLSDLHKQNLEALKKSTESRYRDRAKERRIKYGEPENPPQHTAVIKDMFAPPKQTKETPKRGIDSSNIGNKMLKAMGWNEGQGLGRDNQGRTEIVEAQRRVAVAGLGLKGSNYGANVEDTYNETVKKMMQARYKDSE